MSLIKGIIIFKETGNMDIKQICEKSLDHILTNRTLYMGVAMIMVILYHSIVACPESTIFKVFYLGYLGVDIFLLLSGYGLSNSYSKNSISEFYRHRVVRLLPLFLLLTFTATIICGVFGKYDISITTFIYNMTSLSFWGIGGHFVEWYLCTLILLCLLFPVIYRVVTSYNYGGYFLDILIVIVLLLLTLPLSWYYKCAIGRIPIFCVGILLYSKGIDEQKILRAFFEGSILAFVLFLLHRIETFVVVYMMAPFIIFSVAVIVKKLDVKFNSFRKPIEFIGTLTLEIYVANGIVCYIMRGICIPHIQWLFYILLQVIISLFVIYINKLIKKI